jgi:hypothetical protein
MAKLRLPNFRGEFLDDGERPLIPSNLFWYLCRQSPGMVDYADSRSFHSAARNMWPTAKGTSRRPSAANEAIDPLDAGSTAQYDWGHRSSRRIGADPAAGGAAADFRRPTRRSWFGFHRLVTY